MADSSNKSFNGSITTAESETGRRNVVIDGILTLEGKLGEMVQRLELAVQQKDPNAFSTISADIIAYRRHEPHDIPARAVELKSFSACRSAIQLDEWQSSLELQYTALTLLITVCGRKTLAQKLVDEHFHKYVLRLVTLLGGISVSGPSSDEVIKTRDERLREVFTVVRDMVELAHDDTYSSVCIAEGLHEPFKLHKNRFPAAAHRTAMSAILDVLDRLDVERDSKWWKSCCLSLWTVLSSQNYDLVLDRPSSLSTLYDVLDVNPPVLVIQYRITGALRNLFGCATTQEKSDLPDEVVERTITVFNRIVKAHSDKWTITEQCLGMLQNLLLRNPGTQARLQHDNTATIENAVKCSRNCVGIQRMTGEKAQLQEKIHVKVMWVLDTLWSEQIVPSILTTDRMGTVLSILKRYATNPFLQTRALRAFGRSLREQEEYPSLDDDMAPHRKPECTRCAVTAMKRFPNNRDVQIEGATILLWVSRAGSNHQVLSDTGGFRVLFDTLVRFQTDGQIVTICSKALTQLSKNSPSPSELIESLDNETHVKPAVRLLSSDNADVVSHTIELLTIFCIYDEKNRKFDDGAITKTITDAMSRNKADNSINKTGCVAFGDIFQPYSTAGVYFAHLGETVDAVVDAANAFPYDEELMYGACRIFQALLANHQQLLESTGALKLVRQLPAKFPEGKVFGASVRLLQALHQEQSNGQSKNSVPVSEVSFGGSRTGSK